MAGIQDFISYCDDFDGTSVTFPTAANIGTPWTTVVVGAAPPTHLRNAGNAVLSLTADSQAQTLSLAHGDALTYDIDDLLSIQMRVRLGAAFTSGSELVFGLGSARQTTSDAYVANAWFKMVGANSTTQVYVESDDNVTDNDDIASGVTLGTTFKKFFIDFSGGKSNVKFYIDGIRVAMDRTLSMASYSAGLQPVIQLQKASGTMADIVTIDYVKIDCRR